MFRSSPHLRSSASLAPLAMGLALLLPACGDDGTQKKSTTAQFASGEELAISAFEAGKEFANEGLFTRAIDEFQQAIGFDQDNVAYRMALGEVFMRIERPMEAASVFQSALEIDPENPALHAKLGVIEVQNKRIPEGIARLRKALEYDDSLAVVHFRLGQALAFMSDVKMGSTVVNQEQMAEAVGEIQRAVELEPLNDEYVYWLGRLHEERTEPDEALKSFRAALELNPDHGDAHLRLANILIDRGEVDEGKTHLDRASTLMPDDRRVYFQYGLLAEEGEDLAAAKEAYERCLELDPTAHMTYFRMANVLRRLGQDEEAEVMQAEYEYWQGVLSDYGYWLQESKAKRDDPDVLAQLGEKAYFLGRIEEAVQYLKLAREANMEHGLANAYLGIIFQENGNPTEGQMLLETAIAQGFDGEEIQRSLAAALMDQEKFGEARDVWVRLAEAHPEVAGNHYNVGVAFLKMGEHDAAAQSLSKALELDPSYLKAHFALGSVRYSQKNYDAAAEQYRAILAIEPENADAKAALAEALAGDQG